MSPLLRRGADDYLVWCDGGGGDGDCARDRGAGDDDAGNSDGNARGPGGELHPQVKPRSGLASSFHKFLDVSVAPQLL